MVIGKKSTLKLGQFSSRINYFPEFELVQTESSCQVWGTRGTSTHFFRDELTMFGQSVLKMRKYYKIIYADIGNHTL